MRTKDYAMVVFRMQQQALKAKALPQAYRDEVLSALRDLADDLADSFKQDGDRGFQPWEFIEECGLANVRVISRLPS